MNRTFLSIQATYSHATIALFQQSACLEVFFSDHAKASSHLIRYCDDVLKRHNLTLSALDFIAIDKGPGAFTSLRVALATVNGIAFANKIPLVGIDGLDALTNDIVEKIKNHELEYRSIIVAILNAYNNDVYYAITALGADIPQQAVFPQEKGCKKIERVLHDLQTAYPSTPIIITGNGVTHYQDVIEQSPIATMMHHYPQATASVQIIAQLALEQFSHESAHSYKIEPVYIKSQDFAIAPRQKKE